MVRVKLFCMQKNEEDILEDWILYHSYLFGMDNLYIIDNQSNQMSINILKKYEKLGLHLSVQTDYSKKGEYLFELIKNTQNECDLAIPLDIDEFVAMVDLNNMSDAFATRLTTACLSLDQQYYITRYPQIQTEAKTSQAVFEHFFKKGFNMNWVCCPIYKANVSQADKDIFVKKHSEMILKYYPKETLSCDKVQIQNYLETLPKFGRYSFLYYLTSRNSEIDYDNPLQEIITFDLVDYEYTDGKSNLNKKFFDSKKLTYLDHGNHHGKIDGLPQNQYVNTHLVLFHYHGRGSRKLIEKCRNDIKGLGIVKDINNMRELKEKIKQNVIGAHNIQTYLQYLTSGPGSLCVFDDEGIIIDKLARKIKEIKCSLRGCPEIQHW